MNDLHPMLLRAFVLVASLGTVTAAANKLNRTQAAVSMQIRQLEQAVGARLFARSTSGLTLTKEGDLFLYYAREILELGRRARNSVNERALRGRIRLGVVEDFAATMLVDLLAVFRANNPEIHIDISVNGNNDLGSLLATGKLDVAICDAGSVTRRPLFSWVERLAWVARDDLDFADDATVPIIMFAESCVWRSQSLAALAEWNRNWTIACESSTLVAISAAVRAGVGVAPMMIETIPMKCSMFGRGGTMPPAVAVRIGLFMGDTAPPESRVLADFLIQKIAVNGAEVKSFV